MFVVLLNVRRQNHAIFTQNCRFGEGAQTNITATTTAAAATAADSFATSQKTFGAMDDRMMNIQYIPGTYMTAMIAWQ